MLSLGLGLFAAFCWSVHDLMARKLAPVLGAYRMSVLAMITGFVLLLPAIVSSPVWQAGNLSNLWSIILLGAIYGLGVSSLFKGFAMAPVSIVGPLTAGYPALVVIWGALHGFQPTLVQLAAIGAILVGAIIVGRHGEAEGGLHAVDVGKLPLVIFFSVLASLCLAAAVILGQNIGPRFGEFATTGLLRLPAALVILPFALRETGENPKVKFSSWGFVVIMAALDVTALAGVNYMGRLPTRELGSMGISAYGAVATLLAMLVLKEKVTRPQWFGIALIVAGVAALGDSA